MKISTKKFLSSFATILLTFFGCLFYFHSSSNYALAQTPQKIKKDEEQIREVMVTMSRQLSVTCTTCHISENFKSDKKMEFKVAKEHMKLTQMLIDGGMNGKGSPKADCFMCHRGKLIPDYKEPKPLK